MDEDIVGSNAFFQDPYQDEVRMWFIDFYVFPCLQLFIDPFPLGGDEVSGPVDILLIMEHIGTGDFCQAVDGPRIFLFLNLLKKSEIGSHGIAKSQSGSGEKFGDASHR